MTKMHFQAFAFEILYSDQPLETKAAMARLVIRVAQQFNARFDAQRFLRAAGLDCLCG